MSRSHAGKFPLLSRRTAKLAALQKQQHKLRMRRRLWQPEALESRQLMAGDITGTVFNDLNGNGLDDPSENGLAGWTVFVDANGNGALDLGERSTATDSKGKYELLGVPVGNLSVYEIPQDGFHPSPGFTNHQTVNVRDRKETRVKFPNMTAPVTTGQIRGTVFEDTNENGIADVGEEMLEAWTLFVDANGDGAFTAGEPSTTTDADGNYQFGGIAAGAVNVYEIPRGGLRPIVGGLFPLEGALDHHLVTVAVGTTARTDFANSLPQVGTIQGTVWNDGNGDALRGAGETPMAGQTVFIDLNTNGLIDSGEPTRLTDAAGNYSFSNIHSGSYRITNVMQPGYISADGLASSVTRNVFTGSVNTVDFYNLLPTTGSISGLVWNDFDGNSLRAASEPTIAGWQIFIDLNANGALDAAEPTTLTNEAGEYSFGGVAYGMAILREIVPADWLATSPATAMSTIRLLNGEDRQGLNFGNRERIGTIQGTVWNDANGNRVRSADEAGLADWPVFLDSNGDGLLSADEPATVSAADGTYSFPRLPVGNYRVVEGLQAGWIAAEGKLVAVATTVAIGSVNVVDFYNLTPVAGSISGTVWSDMDSSGTMSLAEIGLADWQVYVDLNNNSLLDAGEPQAVTDAAGNYTIGEVPYGTSTVREVLPPGFTPTNGASRTSLLLNGEVRTGVNFGVKEPTDFVISGLAFNDANRNGVRDPGEKGLSGVTVYLDTNNNSQLDAGEPTTLTSTDLFFTPAVNEIGTYSFTHLARGSYTVREIPTDALSATVIAAREQLVSVGPASAANVNFANNYRANEIHGVVFDDTDADQVQDASERGRGGVAIYVDLNRDDIYEEDEPRTLTGDDGSYAFVGLTPGAYVVREDHGVHGSYTYPTTGGGTLWPTGTSHAAVGNVTPSTITTSLADGEVYSQTVTLTLPDFGSVTNLVDVFLLFDDTGSFTANSPIVRAAFPTIIDTLQASLPGIDLGFGVGRFEEYGSFASELATGRPFILNQPIVAAGTLGFNGAIQAALDRVAPGYGGDTSETDIEALYQLVTGLGFDGNNNGTVLDSGAAGLASTQLNPGASGDVPNFASFVADPTNNVLPAAGNVGGGGFRPGALPIVLLATDTGFAYQPYGESSITGTNGLTLPLSALTQTSRPSTPFNAGAGIQDTVTGLNALGALVIGLGTNPQSTLDPRQGLEALAQLTGAVNRSTTTIANGTPDAIAPGDPLYFQISSGFGTTVADGVVNAIQNAVTNVAMNITVRASDPRVHIINHTGTLNGVAAGQTASFDIEFVGDGRPHRFDLEYVREGTNVVLGSIPVVLGTPVVGEGYQYDELEDGEIHHSSHFGHYVANVAPSFVAGSDQAVLEDAGPQIVAAWATEVSAGPASESAQQVNFVVTNDNPALFSVQPTIAADGSLSFTPAANAFGTAVVTVLLHDNGGTGIGGTDTSSARSFLIQISAVNDAPQAVADVYATFAGTTLTIDATGLLSNDRDAEGDTLIATLAVEPLHGTVVLNADGSFVYTPAPGFSGDDQFVYTASDSTLTSSETAVSITVIPGNRAPVAMDDILTIAEDSLLNIATADVLANDADADGDPLALTVVAAPTHGTLTLNVDGSFRYIPTENFSGLDFFTYQLNDGSENSNIAVVNINITPVNDAPLAFGDVLEGTEDTIVSLSLPGVLVNDSDVDGDVLRAILVTAPTHGTLSLNANGSFVYTPAANYNGIDSFVYKANDGLLDSNVATVRINLAAVNDVPVAIGESFATNQNAPLTVAPRGLLTNDLDVEGTVLSAVLGTGPAHGSLTLNSDGSFNYVPASGYSGADSFTYLVSDGLALSGLATASINVVPAVPGTKFFVVDGDNRNTFKYAADGTAINNHALNQADKKPRGIASNPMGTTQWVVDGGGNVFVYDNNGALLGQWTPQNVGKPEGIAVWGRDLWLVDPTQDRVFKFTGGADLRSGRISATSSFALNSGNLNATDVVTDGAHLWVTNDTTASDKVFRYTVGGTLEGSWALATTNPNPTGITLDPTNVNHLWVVDASTDRVYQYDGASTRLTGSQIPTISFGLAAGNTNPQGIADPLPASSAESARTSETHASLDALFAFVGTAAEKQQPTRTNRFQGSLQQPQIEEMTFLDPALNSMPLSATPLEDDMAVERCSVDNDTWNDALLGWLSIDHEGMAE
jgi:VCBS repeat-containing protein